MPSNYDEKNAIVFRGQYPGNFETKFFPLRFEGILYNSVAYSIMLVYFVSKVCEVQLVTPQVCNFNPKDP